MHVTDHTEAEPKKEPRNRHERRSLAANPSAAEPKNRHERCWPVPLAYSINDFAAASGIGRSKIYELIRLGELRAVKAGGRTLILADAAHDFLHSLPLLTETANAA